MFSQSCIDLVKKFEGCRLTAYPDPGTGGAPWTVGYGHTSGVVPGLTITQAQADVWLKQDLDKANKDMHSLVNCPLRQCQEDALTSFVYNCGKHNFENSTLRIKVNTGKMDEAAKEFDKWVNAAGKPLPGLVKRRAAERALFEGK